MAQFAVRPARAGEARAMAQLFADVAAERDGIATEPPVDIGERTELFARSAGKSLVAVADGFVEEGRRVRQYRRSNGELWDCLVMGLAL